MLDYMVKSVGLPGDSPVREWPFNTGSVLISMYDHPGN